jgi:hypothetical protein
MVAPVQRDGLSDYQVALVTYLRIASPVAGMFTGTEIKYNPNARSVKVPDIRVDDYIVDADIARIGGDHYSGSEFTGEWKNGVPPIFWREYSMSRHRSFGFTVFTEQLEKSPIKNIVQEYTGRKMQTTVVRDHDKYCLLAAVSGHMTGKLVPRTAADSVPPSNPDAARISCTGNAADYKWIAEPGETYDNEIQPSFATITGMFLDDDDPLGTLDALTLLFSDNWFDSNFGNNERFLLITSALELVFINQLIDAGAGTESAFKLLKDGDISGANAMGYLGTLKGSWKLVKIHPEFLPKVYTNASLVVNPIADADTVGHTLRQVIGLAAYKNAIQTYEHFSDRREQDGGTRFKGTEYVQDFSYDCWVIDQLSEGVVPLFLPASIDNLQVVDDSFDRVASFVAAARAQSGVGDVTYPLSSADTDRSRPLWYDPEHPGRDAYLDEDLDVQETGDMAHRHPPLDSDDPLDVKETEAAVEAVEDEALSNATARANTTAVTVDQVRKFASPTSLWKVTTAGTTAGSQPSIAGKDVGDTVTDGTAEFERIL